MKNNNDPLNVRNILTIINDNFSDPNFTVYKLAEKLNISISYLYEISMIYLNQRPQKIIEAERLKCSLNLISDNNTNLYFVCKKSGYSNMKTYRNAFIRRLDITPSNLRNKLLSEKTDTANAIRKEYINKLNGLGV